MALLEGMKRHGVAQMIFSSTAAVFGIPGAEHIPLRESSPHHTPVNPYGETKLVVERLLASCDAAYCRLSSIGNCRYGRTDAIGHVICSAPIQGALLDRLPHPIAPD